MSIRKVIFITLFVGLINMTVSLGPIAETFVKNYLMSEMESLVKNIDLNNTCVRYIYRVASALKNREMWAMRVLDSFSKINPGLLDGNIFNQGSFDECIEINNKDNDFRGQYCTYFVQAPIPLEENILQFDNKYNHFGNLKFASQLNITQLPVAGAICVPDVCTAKDLNYIYKATNLSYRFPNVSLTIDNLFCATSTTWFQNWTWVKWFGLAFFLFHLALMLLSTVYECVLYVFEKKPLHDILLIYSVPTNIRKLFTVKENTNDEIRCIQGLRVLSMMWVILGHRFIVAFFHPNLNAMDVITKWLNSKSSCIIFGSHLAVDTFFFISGVLVFYIYFVAKSRGVRFNIFAYYIHRYIRLTPAVAALIVLSISFYEDLVNGPFFKVILNTFFEPCFFKWWKTLLYVQNLQYNEEMCLGHTWYLGADTQLYVMAPIFFLTLTSWPKAIVGMMGAMIALSSSLGFWKAWDQHLAFVALNIEDPKSWILYSQTQYRAGIWFLGAILGYYLFQTKDVIIRIPKWVNIVIWTVTLLMMGFLIYVTHIVLVNPYQREIHAFMYGFSRNFWGIGLAWVVFACYHGLGGFINTFLSNKIFIVLGRLIFSVYVIHVSVLLLTYFSERTNVYFSNMRILHGYWGDCVNCTLVGLFWNLAFEAPLRNLSNILLKRSLSEMKDKNDINGNTTRKDI